MFKEAEAEVTVALALKYLTLPQSLQPPFVRKGEGEASQPPHFPPLSVCVAQRGLTLQTDSKMVDGRGLEPLTPDLQNRRSPN